MKRNIVIYKPYAERIPDSQYKNLLKDILENGYQKTSIHASLPENAGSGHKHCLELPGRMLQYNLANGAPIEPIRDLTKHGLIKGAIGEIIGFLNGARTLDELISFGCKKNFWENWVTAKKCGDFGLNEGDLGPGSYGPVLTAIPMENGKTFNQVEAVFKKMIKNPLGRTNLLSTWYPPLAVGDEEQGSPRKVVVAPCHGNIVQFDVMDNTTMHMAVYQRSADCPVGLVLNLTEWISCGLMAAYMTNTQLTYYTHFLPDPQIYDIQIEKVQQLLSRDPLRLPSLYLRPKRKIKSITDFRIEDFEVEDYHPHSWISIPSAI